MISAVQAAEPADCIPASDPATTSGSSARPDGGATHSQLSAIDRVTLVDGWGRPAVHLTSDIEKLRVMLSELSTDLYVIDRRAALAGLVNATDTRTYPVHRWYYYKEAFSPRLPTLLVDQLGAGKSGLVIDPFAGVATTGLALAEHPKVASAIGVEYSPLACFIGSTKLGSRNLLQSQMRQHLKRYSDMSGLSRNVAVPDLASFRNPKIFDPSKLSFLLAVRDTLRADDELSELERNFLLLGLISIVEDVSGAMKDGRALRILNGRKRHRQSLQPVIGVETSSDVHAILNNQWLAMIEDLPIADVPASTHSLIHVQGDARTLGSIVNGLDSKLLDEDSAGLFIYSPPYLNCIDYSEVYKLELWFLEYVTDLPEFRALRRGTLRSHPSIEFPLRPPVADRSGPVFTLIDAMSEFLVSNHKRPHDAQIVAQYFADMHESLVEQFSILQSGGKVACVVANSTFSRRSPGDDRRLELWRVPIASDVILARIAQAVGFVDVQVWVARDLRAKNVSGGSARESIVVATKP